MRIGIDLQCLGGASARQWTGIANAAYELTKTLLRLGTGHEFVLFVNEENSTPRGARTSFKADKEGNPPIRLRATYSQSDWRKFVFLPRRGLPFFSNHLQSARIMKKARLDILHGPANVLPWFYQGQAVLTIHDLAIYKHPEWFPRFQWFTTKLLVPRSIKKASRIIVPSETTARDLRELFGVGEEKIVVIPHGVGDEFFKPSPIYHLPSPTYILSVGTLEPRKNLQRLIEAYSALPDNLRAQYDLIIAGGKGWGNLAIRNGEPGIKGKIKFLDYVLRDQLPSLYQHAAAFVYPSLYEGFGLPVLEAMAAGVPVITSNQVADNFQVDDPSFSRLPFLAVNPYEVNEIAEAIKRIVLDPDVRGQLAVSGKSFAQRFTWQQTAQKTLNVYLQAAED